ncbi:MAG: tetratricopeptide repeat protein [Deinococcales bacterium]
MKDRWGLSVLGPATLSREGQAPETLERKAAALLAYAAIAGPVPLLWPNVVDTRARNNLRQLLHRLRSFDELVDADGDVSLGAASVDVAELQDLHAAGRTEAIVERWGAQTPELLEGHSYDDCPDLAEWVIAERERVLEIVRRAIESEADRSEASGDVGQALRLAQRLSALDPLSEADYRRLMRLHYLAGDRGQAMAAFRRCQTMLKETFGLEPLPDTLELARAIDSGTEPRPRPTAVREIPVTLLRPPLLAGRDDAWRALETAWARVHTIQVTGEAGIGKSHLVHDFARTRGPMLVTRGMPGDRDVPYASKARALGAMLREHPEYAAEPWVRDELSRILPDLFERPEGQTPIADEPQKLRLFEAAATVYTRALQDKAVLVNEDLHLWDDASFEMGAYFITRFADASTRAITTLRLDELTPERERTLRQAIDGGLVELVTLSPLEPAAVRELISMAELGPAAPTDEEVLRLSGGNPFYVLEVLRSLWQDGARSETGGAGARPASAAAVLASRIARLSASAADVLRLRAMAGVACTDEVAAAVLEIPVATVRDAVEELERHRLLDHGELVHELVGDAIRDRTPVEAARLWHRRLAAQLKAFGAAPAAVATHFLAAVEPAAAHRHLLLAGDDAHAVLALEEAAIWYRRALWAAGDEHGRAEALVRLDEVASRQGRRDHGDTVVSELERIARALQDPRLLLESALRRAHWLTIQGDHDSATRLARTALEDAMRLGDTDGADRARLVLGDLAYFSGRYADARAVFLEVTAAGQEARRLRAFQRLGALEAMQGDVDAAFDHHREALALARRRRDVPLIATLLNSLGADRERKGAYQEALTHFHDASDVALRSGDRHTGAIALSNAALTHVSRGALAAAFGAAERAVEVATPLGADRSLAMATFARGYALRRLGRLDEAGAALRGAVRLREAASDVRGALVARFNLAGIGLEAAPPARQGAAIAELEGVLDELATLDIPQFYAWCLLELAFLTPDPVAALHRVDEALALDDGEHLRLAASTARLRALRLAGDRGGTASARRDLLQRLDEPPMQETSLAYLLLAVTSEDPEERHTLLGRADVRIAQELGPLALRDADGRRAYLQRRLPDDDPGVELAPGTRAATGRGAV